MSLHQASIARIVSLHLPPEPSSSRSLCSRSPTPSAAGRGCTSDCYITQVARQISCRWTEWSTDLHRFNLPPESKYIHFHERKKEEENQREDYTDLPEISNSVSQGSLCGNVSWLARVMIKLWIIKGKETKRIRACCILLFVVCMWSKTVLCVDKWS